MATYTLTDVNIANMALSLLGQTEPVTSVTGADTSTAGVQMNLWFEQARREALEYSDWNFARVRLRLGKSHVVAPFDLTNSDYLGSFDTESLEVAGHWLFRFRYPNDCVKVRFLENPLGRDTDDIPYEITQTSALDTINAKKITGISKASPGVVTTSAAHGFSSGDLVFITGIKASVDSATASATAATDMVEADGRLYIATGSGTATFNLTDPTSGAAVDTSTFTTYNTTQDAGRAVKVLRGVKCILCDVDGAVVRYTRYETDPTFYSPSFVAVFAAILAEKVSMALTGEIKLASALMRTAFQRLHMGQSVDAQEGMGDEERDADWISER